MRGEKQGGETEWRNRAGSGERCKYLNLIRKSGKVIYGCFRRYLQAGMHVTFDT
jgi:hypothetical protein